MSGFESLSADQRAVLQLLLVRGQTYAQIAAVLRTDAETVRTRAHGALTDLVGVDGPDDLTADELGALADHVLGQSAPGAAEGLLDRSSGARAWQRSARQALADAELAAGRRSEAPPSARPAADAPAPAVGDQADPPASRTGGAIVLGLIAAALVLVVLWIAGVFDGGSPKDPARAASTTKTTGPTSGLRVLQQVNLKRPDGASSPTGVAFFAEQGGQQGMQILAQGLPASSFYALWIQTNERWTRLGFLPAVRPDGKTKGQLQIETLLPKAVLSADRLVISREQVKDPKTPAAVILSGAIKKS